MVTSSPTLTGSATVPVTPVPRRAPPSGWPDVDDLHLVAPGRVTLLDVRAAAGDDLVRDLLAGTVADGREAVVVDGGNWLDAYRLGDRARAHGVTREAALTGVRVARGFTAYQYQALVEAALPRALVEAGDAAGLVVAASFPALYLDEDLPPGEADVLAARALGVLRDLAREHDVPVVVTNPVLAPGTRHLLRDTLEAGVDEVAALHGTPDGGLLVRAPRQGVTVRAPRPGTRQRQLPDYGARVMEAPPTTPPATPYPAAGERRALSAWARMPKRAGEWRALQAREVADAGAH